jgi:hypothetical protein
MTEHVLNGIMADVMRRIGVKPMLVRTWILNNEIQVSHDPAKLKEEAHG